MKTKKLKDLVLSEEIRDIRRVNPVTVSRYRQAMRSGSEFPPLIIEKGTNIIIAGYHRYSAYEAEYGKYHKVKVLEQTFDNPADMIEEAIRDNAKHGLPLDGIGRKRAIIKLSEHGRSPEQIAQLIGISVKRVEALGGVTVVIRGNSEPKPVKRGLEHIVGTTVTKKQYEEHDLKDKAMVVYREAEQITRWLENGWVDLEDARNTEALQKLAVAIEEKLEVVV